MNRMPEHFDPPQAGNPNQLPIDLHVLPAFILRAFSGRSGQVKVHQRARKNPFKANHYWEGFITKRKWSPDTEEILSKIDSEYAVLAGKYLNLQGPVDPADNDALTRFFISWKLRWRFKQQPNTDIPLVGIPPDPLAVRADQANDKDALEKIEKLGVAYVGSNGVPSRAIFGDQIKLGLIRHTKALKDLGWMSCKTNNPNMPLLVPDFVDFPYLPFGPVNYFLGLRPDESAGFTSLPDATLRLLVEKKHADFYFTLP